MIVERVSRAKDTQFGLRQKADKSFTHLGWL